MAERSYFASWLRRLRREQRLTQKELANRVNCTRIYIEKIERGERRPSRETAQLLAQVLSVPQDEQASFIEAARAKLEPAREVHRRDAEGAEGI